jgi:hypothetical protein
VTTETQDKLNGVKTSPAKALKPVDRRGEDDRGNTTLKGWCRMAKVQRLAEEAAEDREQAAQEERKIYVVRKPFKSKKEKGKTYYAYMIEAKVRGRDIKIEMLPPKVGKDIDAGGYGVLEIVFDKSDTAELTVRSESYEQNGKKQTRTIYGVRSADEETGELWESDIVPARPSDRALLEMLLTH